jgi:hypothetical protein
LGRLEEAHNLPMAHPQETYAKAQWLPTMRRYLSVILFGNLTWEVAQLPLYTLWLTGSWREKAFAVAHCTGGDMLIAAACLLGALLVAGDSRWPAAGFRRVAGIAVAAGLAYTVLSEWLNTTIHMSWTYADVMPIVPGLGVGLSPLLQWIVVPMAAWWFARR